MPLCILIPYIELITHQQHISFSPNYNKDNTNSNFTKKLMKIIKEVFHRIRNSQWLAKPLFHELFWCWKSSVAFLFLSSRGLANVEWRIPLFIQSIGLQQSPLPGSPLFLRTSLTVRKHLLWVKYLIPWSFRLLG